MVVGLLQPLAPPDEGPETVGPTPSVKRSSRLCLLACLKLRSISSPDFKGDRTTINHNYFGSTNKKILKLPIRLCEMYNFLKRTYTSPCDRLCKSLTVNNFQFDKLESSIEVGPTGRVNNRCWLTDL